MKRVTRFGLQSLLLIILLSVGNDVPCASSQTCPESCIYTGGTPACTTEPIRYLGSPSCHGCGSGEGRYDLPAGRLEALATYHPVGSGASVVTRDDFRVVGVPEGTLLTFTAELQVSIFGSSDGCGSAGFGEGEATSRSASICGSGVGDPFCCAANPTLTLPLTRLVNEVFRLTSTVNTHSRDGSAQSTGQLRFSGLPQGARVESCQGYVQDVPVPALPASWGSMKARYR